jgi:hypothetical protein
MRLFAKIDGTVDSNDRPMFFILPFDLAWGSVTYVYQTISLLGEYNIGRSLLGEYSTIQSLLGQYKTAYSLKGTL